MTVTGYLLLATLLPLGGFLLLTFLGRRLGRYAPAASTALIFATLALSVGALILYVSKWTDDRPGATPSRYVEAVTRQWVRLPQVPTNGTGAGLENVATPLAAPAAPAVTVGLFVDSLTVAFFIVVSFIGTMVHLFSLGYVSTGEPRTPRYYALLNLLCFAMFALLLSNSLVQIFVAWQLLGIAGYFLIHFHAAQRAPVIGSLRTFITNRIGDAAFLAGMGILVACTGSAAAGGSGLARLVLFDELGTSVLTDSIGRTLQVRSSEFLFFTGADGGGGFLDMHWLTWAGICLATAALIRAAQFPFFSWITDTAEAPPPAAALMQTCTTVAAGVYLLARLYPILTLDVRLILAVVGCATVVLSILVACVQTDVRKILAWTSASQLGYVILFLGAGGYKAGILHLFTHAFAKAALLLAAGAVMHALGGAQKDLRPLGGLWKRMPITAGATLIAVLSLAGTPWLAGSYSANQGLTAVYDYAAALAAGLPAGPWQPQLLLYWLPALATYITAFAIGRWWWLLFVSPVRDPRLAEEAPIAHEQATMTLPLIILAGFAPGLLYEFFGILQYIERSLPPTAATLVIEGSEQRFLQVRVLTSLAPAGFLLAIILYLAGFGAADRLRRLPGINLLYVQLREAFFLDAFFHGVFVRLVLLLARLTYFFDRYILSGIYRLLAFIMEAWAHLVAGIDSAIDRPARRAAWLLAPAFRRFGPPPPPANPNPPTAPP